MNSYTNLLLEREGDIAIITINNPQRANVLSRATMEEMAGAIDVVAADETLRSVSSTGAGERVFIGGADIRELRQLTALPARTFIRQLHALIEKIRRMEKPVIAAVNGVCLGAGLELVVGC